MSENVIGTPVVLPPKASDVNVANPGDVMAALSRMIQTTESMLEMENAETGAVLIRILLNQATIAMSMYALIGGSAGAFRPRVQPAAVVPHLRGV